MAAGIRQGDAEGGAGAGNALEERGDALMREAEAVMRRFTLFSSRGKWEEAADKYQRAANQFKGAQAYEKAAQAFEKVEELMHKLGENGEVTVAMRERVDALAKVDADRASTLIREVLAPRLAEDGKYKQLADLYEELGRGAERDGSKEDALGYYEEAAGYFESENRPSAVSRCRGKVAELSAELERYPQAIQAFEAVAVKMLEKPLTQFNAKKHFLDAGLCMLAQGDIVAAEDSLQGYFDRDYTFEQSREGRLLANLVQAAREQDAEAFTQHVFQFDQISKLSPWRTSVLLKAKKHLQADAGEAAVDLM